LRPWSGQDVVGGGAVRTVYLEDAQREQLERMARSDPKPYRRERAAAILKVAGGQVAYRVAREGLLRRRDPDTVYGWLDRFELEGVAGLTIAPGRGRKPAFFRAALAGAGRGAGRVAAHRRA
jgi:Helix-turn-helix domain